MITVQFGSGLAGYAMHQWQPTYYQEVLGCTPLQAALYFVCAHHPVSVCVYLGALTLCRSGETPVSFVVDWCVAAVETALEHRGVSRLTIRKGTSLIAAIGSSLCTVIFSLCKVRAFA